MKTSIASGAPRNTLGLVFCSSLLIALAGCGVDSPSVTTTNTPPTQSDPPQSDPPQSDAPASKGYTVTLSTAQPISAYELKLNFSVTPNDGSMTMSNSFIVSDGTLVALGPVSTDQGKALHFGALTYGNTSGFTGSAEVLKFEVDPDAGALDVSSSKTLCMNRQAQQVSCSISVSEQ
ncbi:hypothetical protein CWB99_13935 [Pseudoalteromonas rubra]|uniref:Lipoprotein n=1 Tax=Pseudoalteromonas rubra TaxID=43658 RepID=A0A5S3WLR5_9GAMM|nr:hypothetical protein [Pseudoalteromonas rubra]TMP27785.1 hypothetical protein CWB99_13935 [Pseudoalteromonas rubra]TMP32512.1 hypothetical protein CWC00_12585 [Pseudoalteromonas rubra]